MRQVIIARKDLNMSPGKLAVQVAHASMAFISKRIRANTMQQYDYSWNCEFEIEDKEWHDWWNGIFTKTICEAKNLNQLLKAKIIAEELGMKEGEDFFLIWDACKTELEPETFDEDGIGRTLTCIGFKPLDDETAWKISKKFQLYK